MGLEGVARSASRTSFSPSSRHTPRTARASSATASSKYCRRLRFPARRRQFLPADPTTSTSRPARFAASPCAPATWCPARSAAEGQRALLRAVEGPGNQLRVARRGQAQDPVRKPDPRISTEQYMLERGNGSTEDITRASSISFRPSARGSAAGGVTAESGQDHHAAEHRDQHPGQLSESKMIILLIDERPEEVTEMQRSVDAEVISSTFDELRRATCRWPKW